MEIDKLKIYSFPMKPSIFYGFREFKLKRKSVGRIITLGFEIIAKECKNVAEVGEKVSKVPSFLIKSNKSSGIYGIAVESVKRIIRGEILRAPVGKEVYGCGEAISEISSMFFAVPLIEGDIIARIPVVFAREVWFKTPTGKKERVGKAIFLLEPQNFGFLISEKREFERIIESIERKIKSAFEIS